MAAKIFAACPGCFAFVVFGAVVAFIVLTIMERPLEIEANFDSFLKTDVESSLTYDIYMHAISHRVSGGNVVIRRRLQEGSAVIVSSGYEQFDVHLIYQLKGNGPANGLLAISHP